MYCDIALLCFDCICRRVLIDQSICRILNDVMSVALHVSSGSTSFGTSVLLGTVNRSKGVIKSRGLLEYLGGFSADRLDELIRGLCLFFDVGVQFTAMIFICCF